MWDHRSNHRLIGNYCSKGKRWRWCCIIGWRRCRSRRWRRYCCRRQNRRSLAAGVGAAKWSARIALAATLLAIARRNWVIVVAARRLQNPLLGDDWVSTLAIRRVARDGLGFDAPLVDDCTGRPPPRRRRSHRRLDDGHNSTDGRHTPTARQRANGRLHRGTAEHGTHGGVPTPECRGL